MADLLNVADLEASKKHDTFHSEAITGKAGGVAGGADIDYATNQVTGQVQKTLPKLLADIDWSYVGLFDDGVEFTKRSDFTVDAVGIQWVYVGVYPFTATAGTVPTEPTYQVVHVRDHNSNTNLNAVGGHDAIYSRKFNTVADLEAGIDATGQTIDMALLTGFEVIWLGYYVKGDGGGNSGIVKSGVHTDDGGSIFSLGANLYVESIFNSSEVKVEYFGVGSGLAPSINDPAKARALEYVRHAFGKTLTIGEGAFLFNESIDLKNIPYVGFVGAGVDKTVINCGATLSEPFIDVGERIGNINNSSVNYGKVGNFTVRVFGVRSATGVSFANYNRGRVLDIRIIGFDVNYKFAYSWLTVVGKIICQDHHVIGSIHYGDQINAVSVESLSATSSIATSKNHVFEETLSLNIGTLTSEGSAVAALEFKDIKGLTIDNYHHEGVGVIRNQAGANAMIEAGSIAVDSCNMWGAPGTVFSINPSGEYGLLSIKDTTLYLYNADIANLNIKLGCRDLSINNFSVSSWDTKLLVVGLEDLHTYITTNSVNMVINGVDPRKQYNRRIVGVANTQVPTTFKVKVQTSYIMYLTHRNTSTNRAVAKYRLDIFDSLLSHEITELESSLGFNDPTVVNGFVNFVCTSSTPVDVTIYKI